MATGFGSDDNSGTPAPNEAGSEEGAATPVPGADTALDTSGMNFGDKTEVPEWIKAKGIKSVEDGLSMAYEQEKMLGARQVDFPSEDASAEDRDAFYEKAGWPGEVGYKFELTPDLPENFPYDKDAVDKFAGWADKARLAPWQAQSVHDDFVAMQAEVFTANGAATAKAAEADQVKLSETLTGATKALEKTFEAPEGSDAFTTNMTFAMRFVDENGGEALRNEMVEAGALHKGDDGKLQVKAPQLVAALAKAGRALYAEDTALANPNGGKGGANPWAEGASWNVTAQHAMARENPARARQLKAQAGFKS